MRCPPARCPLALALIAPLLLVACSGGGSTPAAVNQSITPCYGDGPTPGVIEPSFDVWQANFAPPTPRQTPTSIPPTAGTPGAPTPTAPTADTPTPVQDLLAVRVDTVDLGSASQFRLTVACQGTVVIPATIDGMTCTFPPPVEPLTCPSATVDLNDFGFSNLRRIGCLIEIGPTEPLPPHVGMCADDTRAGYRLDVTLNNESALSLDLAAHNCRAPESCLHDVFGIDVGD